jgi:hypothetical protein
VADRGYASVLALALIFGGVLLLGVAVDIVRLASAWQEASHLAHVSAETGAGWVRSDSLYAGRLVVDDANAVHAAHQVAVGTGMEASVTATPTEVCVAVHARVEPGLSRLVGASGQSISARACASPHQG